MNIEDFEKLWIEKFAADVPKEDIEKYVISTEEYNNYIWHIFSWKLIPDEAYLSGDEARRAYSRIDKKGAIFIEPFEETDSCPITPMMGSPRVLDEVFTEVYIAAEDFSWTYIKTHEGDCCGPYFYQKK